MEKVTENQKKMIEEIMMNSSTTIKELAGIVGMSERKIKANLAKLKKKNILKRVGSDKGGHWEIISREENKKAKDDNKERGKDDE